MKKAPQLLFLLMLFLLCFNVNAQGYIVTYDNKIYRLESNYSTTLITTVNLPTTNLTDIAISLSGIFYGAVGDGRIIQIDPTTGNYTELGNFLDVGTGLVCGHDNELYFIRSTSLYNELYKYMPVNQTFDYLYDLGGDSPGDLTLYKGNLIFQVEDYTSSAATFHMKAFNLATETLVNIDCIEIDEYQHRFFGLMNLYDSCGDNLIIGIGANNQLYQIDLETNTYTPTTMLWGINGINGMASASEHWASDCMSYVFDGVDCTLGISENQQQDFQIFPNPTTDLVEIKTNKEIEEIKVFDTNGKMVLFIKDSKTAAIGHLEKGIYVFQVKTPDATHTQKIIKQ